MLTPEDIHKRMSYQKPTEEAAKRHDVLNNRLETIALMIEGEIPEGREKSLAHTHLEEVRFWGNAVIARNHSKL